MANNSIAVELDISDIEKDLETSLAGINELRVTLLRLHEIVVKGFVSTQETINAVKTGIDGAGQSLGTALGTLTSAVSSGMSNIVQGVDKIFETLSSFKSEQAMGSFSDGAFQAVDLTFKAMELMKQYAGTGNSSSTGTHKATPLLTSGHVDDAFVKNGGSLGENLSSEEVVQGIGNVIAMLQENISAWASVTAAKLASKAEDIAIIGLYVGDFVKAMASSAAQLATNTAGWIANAAAKAGSTAAEWAQIAATTAWTAICSAATAVTSAFGVALSVLTSPITLVIAGVAALVAGIVLLVKNWDTVKQAAIRAWEGIKAAFGTAWSWFESKVLNPLVGGIKGGINGVIGFINGLIAAAVKGINSLIGMLNKLRFTVPDWVPGLGGETIGFSLSTIKAPQIPYLAKGAVLPANKPFLAMVGDQKHGTNVEAPLATIQEAVAMTMEDMAQSNLAGHRATVEVLQKILEAVLGIRIGDAELYRAVERYREKRGVMLGTGW